MLATLSGAGGANCQLCTATFSDLKDLELVKSGKISYKSNVNNELT